MRDYAVTPDTYSILPTPRDQSTEWGIDEYALIREMHHRMANTLTLLTAQLWHEFGLSTVPRIRKSLTRCEARIAAFGRLHRLLAVGARNRPVAVRDYVEELCRSLSEAVLSPLRIRCEVSAADGILPGGTCERLGLIVAELVTNAAKHAFASQDGGRVRVEVTRKPGHWLCTVSDNGTGIQVPMAESGTNILDDIAQMIGGTIALRSGPNGTSVTVTFSN
jgi:two-component sensor histidine kinase